MTHDLVRHTTPSSDLVGQHRSIALSISGALDMLVYFTPPPADKTQAFGPCRVEDSSQYETSKAGTALRLPSATHRPPSAWTWSSRRSRMTRSSVTLHILLRDNPDWSGVYEHVYEDHLTGLGSHVIHTKIA
jgi:hypothetical protein